MANAEQMQKLTEQIVGDLMTKVGDDIGAVLKRTLSIVPDGSPQLPVALAGAAASLGYVAAILANMAGNYDPKAKPDADNVLLAGLLATRTAMGGDDPIGQAYADLRTLQGPSNA